MADQYGAVAIPVELPAEGDAAGDRALSAIGQFAKAVFNAAATTAWQDVDKTTAPVVGVFAHDPKERSFNTKDLPALYLYRTGGRAEDWAADYRVEEGTITVDWVFPPARPEFQRQRDPIANALVKTLDAALLIGRDAAWVHVIDRASVDGIKLAFATTTAAAEHTGDALDGFVGSRKLSSRRRITVTASTATGAYALTPITIHGLDVYGDAYSEAVTPTSVDGGWQLETDAEFTRVDRVSVPAQTLMTGSLQVGHTEDEMAAEDGSLLLRVSGADRIRLTEWKATMLTIPIESGTHERSQTKTQKYEMVTMTLSIREVLTRDPSASPRIWPNDEVEIELDHEDGTALENFIA